MESDNLNGKKKMFVFRNTYTYISYTIVLPMSIARVLVRSGRFENIELAPSSPGVNNKH